MSDLRGKCAFITGSVQGIGFGIAESLAAAGAKIAVHGLATPEQAEVTCAKLKAKGAEDARFFAGDLRNPAEIRAMIEAAQAWAPLDILINNAGIQHTAPFASMPEEKWNAIIAINLSAAFLAMQQCLPSMATRGYGRVINIASVHGLVASKEKAPYVAAKFGLVGLSRVAALEYAASGTREKGGVTVNCICPGWTETDLIAPQIAARAAAHGGDRNAGIADLLSEKQPSLRMSDPSEIGMLALWLCAPQAHNITGIALPIDGGWTAQ